MYNNVKSIASKLETKLIEIKRELHQYPELALKEYKTAEIIVRELKKIPNIKVYENMAEGTGVVGVLEGTKVGAKCVLLRADIDALPIQEMVESEHKSKNNGYMHACGHDANATWLLGSAMILSELQDEIQGTVKFVFQPGEECGLGAKSLIEDNKILENPKVDVAFAAHVWPSIPSGKVGIAPKYAFGCPGSFHIKIIGHGGHASWPHECINPITVANQICTNLQYISSSKIDTAEPHVISVASIHAGEKGVTNIIPDTCTISGTFRATNINVMTQIEKEIKNIVLSISNLYRAKCEIAINILGEAVENSKELIHLSNNTINKLFGPNSCNILEKDNLGGENFSEFSKRVPSCYLYIGNETEENKGKFGLHSPLFEIDESILSKASATLSSITIEYLNS